MIRWFRSSEDEGDEGMTIQDLMDYLNNDTNFNMLANGYGRVYAVGLCRLIWEGTRERIGQDLGGGRLRVAQNMRPFVEEYWSMAAKVEWERICSRTLYIWELWDAMTDGELRAILAANAAPAGNYARPGAGDVENAGRWAMTDANRERGENVGGFGVAAMLHDRVNRAGVPFPLGGDIRTLNQIHLEVMRVADVERRWRAPNVTNANVTYPSNLGGQILLKYIFETYVNGYTWPQRGDDRWENVAMFFLAAIMAVQGFVDGNKRTARAVYALIVLRGGLNFRAPNRDIMNTLADMGM